MGTRYPNACLWKNPGCGAEQHDLPPSWLGKSWSYRGNWHPSPTGTYQDQYDVTCVGYNMPEIGVLGLNRFFLGSQMSKVRVALQLTLPNRSRPYWISAILSHFRSCDWFQMVKYEFSILKNTTISIFIIIIAPKIVFPKNQSIKKRPYWIWSTSGHRRACLL